MKERHPAQTEEGSAETFLFGGVRLKAPSVAASSSVQLQEARFQLPAPPLLWLCGNFNKGFNKHASKRHRESREALAASWRVGVDSQQSAVVRCGQKPLTT